MSVEPIVLVCARVRRADGSTSDAVAGSIIHACAKCGRDVWVAPSGVAKLAELPQAIVVCIEDAHALMRDDPDVKIGRVTSDQIDELREHYDRPES